MTGLFHEWYYVVIGVVVLYLISIVRILFEYERGVVFRLGRVLHGAKGPGLILVFWPIDKLVKVDIRVITMDVPPQDIITRDNVSCSVNAVTYFCVMDAVKAVTRVANYLFATSQLAQTTLRSVLGETDLDTLLSQREMLNKRLQEQLDKHTDPWGIKVTGVEIKQVDLPAEMRRAMAKQAEAERERRAKIIHAEGEFEAAQKLQEASAILSREPIAVQLRYLETLTKIGTEKNTTVVFPLPIDLVQYFMKAKDQTK